MIEINNQRREDMLVGALEEGSNYWYWIDEEGFNTVEAFKDKDNHEPFSTVMWKAIMGGKTIKISDKEDQDIYIGEINLDKVKSGEQLMLENSPKHFYDIINETDDAITADVWFQYCVLGEVIYG